MFLISKHDQDRDAYQKLLADYNSLEQRSEALEVEIACLQRVGTRLVPRRDTRQICQMPALPVVCWNYWMRIMVMVQ